MVRRREPRVLLLLFGVADGVCGLLLGRVVAFWTLSVQPEPGAGPPFWVVFSSTVFRYPEPRRWVCCCWLSTCACPGMALLARNHPLAGAREPERGRRAAGNRTNGQFQDFALASLSSSRQGGVATFVEPGSGPPLTVFSLSPTGRSGSRQYRGGQSGRSSRPLVCKVWYQTAAGQGRKLMFTTPRWSIPRRATDSVIRSSSSWAFAVPSDGSCPWEQRDNHYRTGDPVLVMREGL